jgi:cytochrome c553
MNGIDPAPSNEVAHAASPSPRRSMAALFGACAAGAGLLGAAPALAQNATVGQQLWDSGRSAPPPTVLACGTCHNGAAAAANGLTLAVLRQRLTNNGGLTLANAQAAVTRSLTGVQAMRDIYPGTTLSATDISNLAAYIANVPAPAPAPTPPPPAPANALQVNPEQVMFAATPPSTNSAQQTVTVRNGTSAAVTLGNPAITASNSSLAAQDFLLSTPGIAGSTTTCTNGATLAAGATCTLGVIFRPTATGQRSAAWEVRFSSAGANPLTLALQGTGGTAPTPTPAPSPAPSPAPAPAPGPAPAPAPAGAGGGSVAGGITNAGAGALGLPALGVLAAALLRRRRPQVNERADVGR